MAKNVCLDCGYFLNCKLASEHLTYCQKFVKAHRTITKIERRNDNGRDEKYRLIQKLFNRTKRGLTICVRYDNGTSKKSPKWY